MLCEIISGLFAGKIRHILSRRARPQVFRPGRDRVKLCMCLHAQSQANRGRVTVGNGQGLGMKDLLPTYVGRQAEIIINI